MNKEEHIKKYGEEAYEKHRQQTRDWQKNHPKGGRERSRLRRLNHPEQVKASNQEAHRKGGKYYEHTVAYMMSGLPHERNLVRMHHRYLYRKYKQIIAPDSQLHHEWIHETANYRGVALVEANQHLHGFIDVIQILEGKITLLTEEEIKSKS